jgi:hypothetical protein
MPRKREKAERFTEIHDEGKQGWNVVLGCWDCNYRRTKKDGEAQKLPTNEQIPEGLYPGPEGSCRLLHPPWPKKPPQCSRSVCPANLRVTEEEEKGIRERFKILPDPDRPRWFKRMFGKR